MHPARQGIGEAVACCNVGVLISGNIEPGFSGAVDQRQRLPNLPPVLLACRLMVRYLYRDLCLTTDFNRLTYRIEQGLPLSPDVRKVNPAAFGNGFAELD
ncbi:MAG: hypothetical protein DDT25_00243 [Chloroflexi bacterium]|nr:hypothetical protein [Chloroflexota bacterium]